MNINFRFIEWQYGIRPPTTLPVAAGNDNIDFYTIIYTTRKNYKKTDKIICPKYQDGAQFSRSDSSRSLVDVNFLQAQCSKFNVFPMSHPWAFPPDHQSFAKGTLSLQEHKNTQGVTQSLVIQSNLNYKKQSFNLTNYLGTPRPSTPRESPSALVGTKK